MPPPVNDLLRRHGLRSTPVRRVVLEQLGASPAAVALSTLNKASQADRITLYRTLKTFEDLGIVHRVNDADGHPQYALCGGACTPEAHAHVHPHFQCEDCGHTYCLPEVATAPAVLPEGYLAHETHITYAGRCGACTDGANAAA